MNYRNSKKICRTLGTMVFAGTMLVGCKSSDNIKADVKITLSDDSCKCDSDSVSVNKNTITINDEGTYVVSGSLSDGQIIVDAKDKKVEIILDNTEITSKTSAAIYVKKSLLGNPSRDFEFYEDDYQCLSLTRPLRYAVSSSIRSST